MKNVNSCSYSRDQAAHEKADRLKAKVIKKPFSDYDIIELQDTLLTNGFHYMKVKDIDEGRSIVTMLLQSLNHYQDIACLSLDETPENYIDNIYTLLKENDFLDDCTFAEFFVEFFYYDFLWIELSKKMLKSKWFSPFKQMLIDLEVQKKMPIILLCE